MTATAATAAAATETTSFVLVQHEELLVLDAWTTPKTHQVT
jgi:hypothetical protein